MPMTHEEMIRFVDDLYAATGAGDWDRAAAMLTDDFFVTEAEGLPMAGVYRGKYALRDLFIKVIERWYHAMLSDYDRQLTGISGTRNRLRYMIWRHLATVHEEPALCRLMFELVRSGPEYSGTAIFELNRQYTRRTLDIVRQGMENGELRPGLELRLVDREERLRRQRHGQFAPGARHHAEGQALVGGRIGAALERRRSGRVRGPHRKRAVFWPKVRRTPVIVVRVIVEQPRLLQMASHDRLP